MNLSFYNGVSGMKTHQNGIDLLSDNIANVSTPGYRSSTSEFSTIYSMQLNQVGNFNNPTYDDLGVGSVFKGASTNFKTGTLVDSDNKYDLAIQGDGWFGVLDDRGKTFYTRAGNFNRDENGNLVNGDGNFILGTSANNVEGDMIIRNPNKTIKVDAVGKQEPIKIPDTLKMQSQPTTFVNFAGPLDPTVKTKYDSALNKKVEIPNVEVYRTDVQDAQGNTNKLNITFTKSVPQQSSNTTWSAKAILSDKDGNFISESEGTLNFNGVGALTSNTLTTIDNNGTPLDINLGSFYDRSIPNSGYDGLIALTDAGDRSIKKDGNKSGILEDYNIDSNGNLLASFSNGQTIPIAKVAVYHFTNEQGLEKIGGTRFRESVNSGKASFFTDKDGNFVEIGKVQNRKVELSNLNMTTALTDLIALQKAYDASSKSITTSDQMIQNAINMKK